MHEVEQEPEEDGETAAMAYFDEMSLPRRAWESVGGAITTGAITGVLLGVNLWCYIAAIVVSVVGGIPAGSEHRTLGGAALRGFIGGTFWGTALLITHELTGATATATLPEPSVAFLPFCVIPPVAVAVVVWLATNRRRAAKLSAR